VVSSYQTPTVFGISTGPLSQFVDEDTPTRVKLPRDVLLKFNSEEYDDYIKRVSQKRPLSETEHKVARNQRRKIKNREYAQISRTNKKNQHTQLSTAIEHLNQQNTELIDRINQLEAENKKLQEENHLLMNFSGTNSMINLDHSLSTYSPPSPPLSQSPLANTSSEESVDLFSEDFTDNYLDWSTFTSTVPFTLFTVFCCLLLFYPYTGSSPTKSAITEATASIGLSMNDRLTQFNSYHRKLLNDKHRYYKIDLFDQPYEDFSNNLTPNPVSTVRCTPPISFLTIEDVLNEELSTLVSGECFLNQTYIFIS